MRYLSLATLFVTIIGPIFSTKDIEIQKNNFHNDPTVNNARTGTAEPRAYIFNHQASGSQMF